MTTQQANELANMPIKTEVDWKFGLITRTIFRLRENLYQIHDFSSGWSTATVYKDELINILTGKLSLTELNWR